jgi:hypothetical protein
MYKIADDCVFDDRDFELLLDKQSDKAAPPPEVNE